MNRSTRSGLLIATAIGALTGCAGEDGGTGPTGPPVGIVVTPGDTAVREGRQVTFHARLIDSAGQTVPGQNFSWSSEDTAIATISPIGTVSAKHIGVTLIRASTETMTGLVSVTIIDSNITTRLMLAGSPFGIAVSGSKSFVTRVLQDSLEVLDVPGELKSGAIPTGATPTDVVFNPGGTRAYVANQASQSVSIIAGATNTALGTTDGPNNPLAVLTSGDGARLWATSGSVDFVYAFNTVSNVMTDSATTPHIANGLARHPTLPRLYVSGAEDGRIYELESTTLDSLRAWSLGGSAQGIAVSPDGARLYVANEDGWVDVIALNTGSVTKSAPLPGGPYGYGPFGLALSPDGTKLATSVGIGSVEILDATTLATIRSIPTGGVPRRLAYSADGTRLLVANEGGWVDFIR
jgi:YVTN family beta-propeller protein